MIPEGYVQALADLADEQGSAADLVTERDALSARMNAAGGKGGKELVQANLRTKQFQFQVSMTVEEKFTAYQEAIKLYRGGTVPMTYGVWPFITR